MKRVLHRSRRQPDGGPLRIRFFNLTDTAAPFFRDLVPSLVESGHRVDLVLSAATYREGLGLADKIGDSKQVKVVQTADFGAGRGFSAKILTSLAYAFQASFYSLLGPRVHVNVFLTQPPMFFAWGLVLRWLRGQPCVCVVMDLYPDLFWEIGNLNRTGLVARGLGHLSLFVLNRCAAVVAIGRCMLRELHDRGVTPARLHLIRNWVDARQICPIPHEANRFRIQQAWGQRVIVLYAGNIGVAQYFDDLLETASLLQDRKDIGFVFIGDGSRHAHLVANVQERQLSNVLLLPFQHEVYPLSHVLSAGDVHFVSLRAGCSGLAVPSKSYTIHATGRPILYQGARNDEVALTLGEEDAGTFVGRGDVSALTSTILAYADQPDFLRRQGERARKLALTRYSQERALGAYHALFETLQEGDEEPDAAF